MYVVDTGFIVALALPSQPRHSDCAKVYNQIKTSIYLPQIVLGETAYLIEKYAGKRAFAKFIQSLPAQKYVVTPLENADLERAAAIYLQYHDTRLDFVDSSVIALAERLNISTILTLDQRDFSIVKPAHVEYLTLLP
jgi:uncharacterized protein